MITSLLLLYQVVILLEAGNYSLDANLESDMCIFTTSDGDVIVGDVDFNPAYNHGALHASNFPEADIVNKIYTPGLIQLAQMSHGCLWVEWLSRVIVEITLRGVVTTFCIPLRIRLECKKESQYAIDS